MSGEMEHLRRRLTGRLRGAQMVLVEMTENHPEHERREFAEGYAKALQAAIDLIDTIDDQP